MKAAEIATTAATLISGDRDRTHGNKKTNFENIAKLWSAWLSVAHGLDTPLSGVDVAKLMVLLKLARMESGEYNPDDALDLVGYGAILGELQGVGR